MPAKEIIDKDGQLWLFRGLGLVTAVNVPVFRLLLDPEAYDPMWMRWTICAFVIGAVLLTFIRSLSSAFWVRLVTASAAVLSTWMLFLTYENGLHPHYATSYIVLLFSALIIFRSLQLLVVFATINLIGSGIVAGLVVDPKFSPILLLSMVASLEIVTVAVMLFGIRERKQMEGKEGWMKTVSSASFEMNGDGILVTALDGRVLAFNKQLLTMWNLAPEDISIGQYRSGVEKITPLITNLQDFEESHRRARVNYTLEVTDELKLIDGRCILRISKPLLQKNSIDGRIWFFRDVTVERVRATALEESRRKLRLQHDTLVQLAGSPAFRNGDLQSAFAEASATACSVLGTARTGIWTFGNGGKTLDCAFMSHSGRQIEPNNMSIDLQVSPAYFEALRHERVMAIENTSLNPLTAPFVGLNGNPRLHAALDVPFRRHGEVAGVICSETDGETRVWTDDEQHFLIAIGDLLSMLLEANERALAENEKHKALAVVKAIFQRGGIGVLITGANKAVLDYNQQYLDIWGMDAEFITQKTGDEIIQYCRDQIQNPETASKAMAEVMSMSRTMHFDILNFKDGRVIERQACPVELEGQLFGHAWIYRDITDRINAERSLFESEQRNHAIISALPDLIMRLDKDGTILDHRLPEVHTFGSIAGKLGNVHVSTIMPPACIECITKGMLDLAEGKGIFKVDMEMDLGKGMQFFEGRLVSSGQQQFLFFVRDVTERKQTENELIQRNFELDSFVYRASHDLKAPLNSLMGLVGILQGETDDVNLLRYISMMDKSLVKLDTFIRNLNDFSRIARSEVVLKPISILPFLEDIMESLQYMEGAQRVNFQTDIEAGKTILADSFNLGIVLTNLLSNAIKYQNYKKESSEIRVSVKEEGNEVVIRIADNGVGVATEHQGRIFDLFFRASNQSFGSGLGLYITRNAVQKMGGTIKMESWLQEGTTFEVRLPIKVGEKTSMEA